MDLTLIIADTVTIATKQGLGLGFAKFLLPENSAPSNGILQISAIISPIDALLAPPPVRSSSYKTAAAAASRTLLRKKRRTRRRSFSAGGDDDNNNDGGSEDGEDCGFFGGGGSGGSGGGNWGGRGWNFDGFGGQNWDEYSSNSWSGLAFDFVYEVIFWIALSNCVHFAFKKMVRIVADTDREKVPMRLC